MLSLLHENFLFWQRGNTSLDGKDCIARYKFSGPSDLPQITVVDPRTGVRVKSFKGYVPPTTLVEGLVEFLSEYSLDVHQPIQSRRVVDISDRAIQNMIFERNAAPDSPKIAAAHGDDVAHVQDVDIKFNGNDSTKTGDSMKLRYGPPPSDIPPSKLFLFVSNGITHLVLTLNHYSCRE